MVLRKCTQAGANAASTSGTPSGQMPGPGSRGPGQRHREGSPQARGRVWPRPGGKTWNQNGGAPASGSGTAAAWWLLMAPAAPSSLRPAPRAGAPGEPSPSQVGRRWRNGMGSSRRLTGSSGRKERNLWEDAALAHRQQQPGVRGKRSRSRPAGSTKKGGSRGHGPSPRVPARTPQAAERGAMNFPWKPATSPLQPQREAPSVAIALMPPHLCGSQDLTRKALQSQPEPGSLPGTRPARSQPPVGSRSLRRRHRAARLGACPREARKGMHWGLVGDPTPSPLPNSERTCKTISIRRRRPSPTGPGPRVSGAGKKTPRGWPAPRVFDHPVPARHPAAPRVRAGAPPAARRAGHAAAAAADTARGRCPRAPRRPGRQKRGPTYLAAGRAPADADQEGLAAVGLLVL